MRIELRFCKKSAQSSVYPIRLGRMYHNHCSLEKIYPYWALNQVFIILFLGSLIFWCCGYPLKRVEDYVFRDALLHTTVVMCGYLRCCHLPASFDQSGPSPLTSLNNEAFLPAELLLTGCFSHHCLQTLETVLHKNLSRSTVSEIFKPPVWHQQSFYGQRHLDHIYSPF